MYKRQPAASPWKDDGVYNDNFGVVMGAIGGSAPQTVTIDGAGSPTIIMVQADTTDYVWDAAAGCGSLEGNGNLEKTGNAKLTINTANTNYTGKVIPVSYTHLDVYKRQTTTRSPTRETIPR